MFQTVLFLFVMHDGYRKLIGSLNFIKHCDWFNLCQKYQFPWRKKLKKHKKSGIESMSKISIPIENKNEKTKKRVESNLCQKYQFKL